MLDELKKNFKGEIATDDKELDAFSRDASIFMVKPKVVIRPMDAEDVKTAVKYVAENKAVNPDLSLTARAAGTDMSGGPLNESIIVDFTAHMNKVLEVGEGWARTEPGVFYRDFEKATLKKGYLLASYPASRELCAIGGIISNNSGGEKSLRYGKTEKFVQELSVVLSDGNEYSFKPLNETELAVKKSQNDFEGELYRKVDDLISANKELIARAEPDVTKNSAGYALWNVRKNGKFDMTQLFVGAQGTLGLVTKAKLGLIKPDKYSRLLVVFMKNTDHIGDLIVELKKYDPESLESYDDHTFKLALKIFPSLIRRIGLSALFRFIPDGWLVLTGGIPKLVVIAEFTGNDEKAVLNKIKEAKADVLAKFPVKARIASSDGDARKYWTIRRESFNLLRQKVQGKRTAPFIDDVVVQAKHLPKFLPELNQILKDYSKYMMYTIAGHPGDGNFHIIPLMDLSDEESVKAIPELSEKVFDLVAKYKGSMTGEHNDGLVRTPYLEKMYGSQVVALFNEVKKIFDPQNIFNPRKKAGEHTGVREGLAYAFEHINRDMNKK